MRRFSQSQHKFSFAAFLNDFLKYIYISMCFMYFTLSQNTKYLLVLHSSEIRGLHSTKCSSETLQNLLYFMYKKTHVVFFVFHFVQFYILPYECPGLYRPPMEVPKIRLLNRAKIEKSKIILIIRI